MLTLREPWLFVRGKLIYDVRSATFQKIFATFYR